MAASADSLVSVAKEVGGGGEEQKVSRCVVLKMPSEEPFDAALLLRRIRHQQKMQRLRERVGRFLGVASEGVDHFMDCFSP